MKRLYEWITKTNQVLLFLLALVAAILVSRTIYVSFQTYEPPHVSVAQTEEEAKASVVEEVEFLSESSGVYILGIMKRVITDSKEGWLRPRMAYLGADSSSQTVNIVFSRGEQRLRTLLPKDGLVLSNNIFEEKREEKIGVLLFRCVTEDTDGNRRLDEKDRNDLYLVSDDLEKPDIVVEGIEDYRVISPTHVMVKLGQRAAARFWDIDIGTGARKEIVWK